MSRRIGRVKALWDQWHYFNHKYFGGKLTPPKAIRLTKAHAYDGYMKYKADENSRPHFHLKGDITLAFAARLDQWNLMGTLLHEMIHMYQVQVLEVEPLHDKVFNSYCRWIERQTNFPLRTSKLA